LGLTMNKVTACVAAFAAVIGTSAFAADMPLKAPPTCTSARL